MKVCDYQVTGVVLLVLFSSCRPAPVLPELSEKNNGVITGIDGATAFREEERELESLAKNIESGSSDVKVEEHHHVTYENVNGKEQKVHETEKAVINNGKVVSDVKQEVTETEGKDGKPETHVETEIDIPSKGIHEKYSDDRDNELSEDDSLPNPGVNIENVEESFVTPQALAEYLWDTQDFGKFRAALDNIVDSKIMSPEEAQAFYQEVVIEYDKLRQLNSLFPFQSEDEETFLSPMYGQQQEYSNIIPGLPANELTLPVDTYPQKRLPQIPAYQDEYQAISDYDLEQQREAYELNAAIQRQAAVDDMLRSLLEDWFASAIESGDTDTAKLVSDLASYLSQQTDVMSQYDDDKIRQVLAEVFATMAAENEEVEEDSEIKPLPQTEGIEQQLKNIPEHSEENKSSEEEHETESSGDVDNETKSDLS